MAADKRHHHRNRESDWVQGLENSWQGFDVRWEVNYFEFLQLSRVQVKLISNYKEKCLGQLSRCKTTCVESQREWRVNWSEVMFQNNWEWKKNGGRDECSSMDLRAFLCPVAEKEMATPSWISALKMLVFIWFRVNSSSIFYVHSGW